MTDTIKLDIISDVACPWCIIGYNRLVQAMSELAVEDKFEIEWQPFQLNADMPAEGEEVRAHISRKYGISPADADHTLAQMTALGAEQDFVFDFFDGFKMVNTGDLHILLDYAKESGKQTELKMRLFEAFFSERKDVSDRQVLAQELERLGLRVKEGMARLDSEASRDQALAKEAYWKSLGISAVPTIVFDQLNSLTGAQPISVYKEVLAELLENSGTQAIYQSQLA